MNMPLIFSYTMVWWMPLSLTTSAPARLNYFQDTVNLTKERNPFYPMADLKFLLLDGHIRAFLCLPHYLCCGCLTTFFTSHHCVPRHNLCGASAGRAPLNLTWRVVPWLSQLGRGHKCTIVSVFTEVLIILHRSSEIYQHTEGDVTTVWKLQFVERTLQKYARQSLSFQFLFLLFISAHISGNSYHLEENCSGFLHLNDSYKGWICVMTVRRV